MLAGWFNRWYWSYTHTIYCSETKAGVKVAWGQVGLSDFDADADTFSGS